MSWFGTCGVTYRVRYSTSSGNISEPPSGAVSVSVMNGNSTLLTGLSLGTTYYVWVAAVSSDTQGPYSNRLSTTTRRSNDDPVEKKMKEGKRRKKRLLYPHPKALFRFSSPIGSFTNRHIACRKIVS